MHTAVDGHAGVSRFDGVTPSPCIVCLCYAPVDASRRPTRGEIIRHCKGVQTLVWPRVVLSMSKGSNPPLALYAACLPSPVSLDARRDRAPQTRCLGGGTDFDDPSPARALVCPARPTTESRPVCYEPRRWWAMHSPEMAP